MADNARSTYRTYLMYEVTPSGGTATWTKVCAIKSFPDLGGEPERLQTTTLEDVMHTYIKGIQDTEALSFTANYTKDSYKKLSAIKGTQKFQIWFVTQTDALGSADPVLSEATDGKWQFEGELDVYVTGGGVDEVVELAISITPSTEIEFVD